MTPSSPPIGSVEIMENRGGDGAGPHDPRVRAPKVAGRYKVEHELARGGMAVVYRAVDEIEGRAVALKRMLPSSGEHAERVLALFRREYYTLAQLRHPRIIEVYDYGSDAEGAYYTMELLDGSDLREASPLEPQVACRHLRDVASSLALLHARRLLHRDVSARNVRLTGDGRAKLIDFGALTNFGPASHVVGTPPAVPPEALNRLDLDQRSDLFALGALAYWVLTGRHAYPARAFNQLPLLWKSGSVQPPSRYAEGVSAELDDLVLSLLSLDIHGRPRSAADVIDRLTELAGLPEEYDLAESTSYLVNPNIVGREAELDSVRRGLARVDSGEPAGMLVLGDAGAGKTRLLLESSMEAQLSGAIVVRVDAESHPGPWGAIKAVCRSLLETQAEALNEVAREHAGLVGHVVPELAAAAGVDELSKLPRDLGEQRMRLQATLCEVLAALATDRTLAIAVDNAHAADDSSLSVLASLLSRGEGTRIAVSISSREGERPEAPAALKRLSGACYRLSLRGLSVEDTTALADSLFAGAANHQKLGAWLHAHTGGNPLHCLELASRLVHEGVVRYEAGVWVLPEEMPDELEGSEVGDLHGRRFASLSAQQRELAEVLSVERVPVPLDKCLALCELGDAETFTALSSLVAEGVLLSEGECYRFAHAGLREHILEGLEPGRRRRLHDRSGEYALSQLGQDSSMALIDAGWHLMRGDDELRGAQLLEEASRDLVTSIEGLQFAAPVLEAALEVFDRHGSSEWMQLAVLQALTSAGWYVDYRYAERHGKRALDISLRLSGLSAAEKLVPVMGERAALKAGVAWAAGRHALQSKKIRYSKFRNFQGVFHPLVGNVGVLVGIAANLLDGDAARRVLDRARLLRAFEEGHVLSVMHKYATYYTLCAEGRMSEAEPIGLQVYEWFRSEAGVKVLGPEGAEALAGGIMIGLGQFGCFGSKGDPELWAQRLEDSSLSFNRAMGVQTRYVHHCIRGEMDKARAYRDRLEQQAIHGATLWQSSVLVPLLTACACARIGDEVGLKHMASALERVADSMSLQGLKDYVSVFRAYGSFLAGRPEKARRRLEAVLPRTGIGQWTDGVFVEAAYARILLGCGDTQGARRVLREARAKTRPADFDYLVLSQELLLAEAEVEMASGKLEEAAELYERALCRLSGNDSPLVQFKFHAGRARVALPMQDEEAFEYSWGEASHWARRAGNPTLIAAAKRLRRAADRVFGKETSDVSGEEGALLTAGAKLRSMLEDIDNGRERAVLALEYAVQTSGAESGYLYLGPPEAMQLVCAQPRHHTPPSGFADDLRSQATELHASFSRDDFTQTQTQAATAMITASASATSSGTREGPGIQTDWLVVERADGSSLVGALVLCPSEMAPLQRLNMDELQVIASECG